MSKLSFSFYNIIRFNIVQYYRSWGSTLGLLLNLLLKPDFRAIKRLPGTRNLEKCCVRFHCMGPRQTVCPAVVKR